MGWKGEVGQGWQGGGLRGGRVGVQRWQGGLGSGDRAVWGGFRDGRAGWGQGRVG